MSYKTIVLKLIYLKHIFLTIFVLLLIKDLIHLWKAYPRGQRGRDKFKLVKEPALVRIQQPSILTDNREYESKRRSPGLVLYDRVSKIRCRDLSLYYQ